MKKAAVLVILCGLAAFMAGGCALSPGDDFTMPRDTKQKGTYIVDYNLQTYIPVPVAGEHAIKQVTQRGDLEAVVTWKDQDGNELPNLGTFQADTVYTAEIKVTPRAGYLFDPSIDFGYPQGRIAAQTDDRGTPTRTLTVTFGNSNNESTTFSIQQVVLTDLTDYIIRPVIGNEPVRSTFGNDQYEGSEVNWEPSGIFTANTPYTAAVTLNAKDGYTFTGINFSHTYGTPRVVSRDPDGLRLSLELDFPAAAYPSGVSSIVALTDLTACIIPPVTGNTPVTNSFSTEEYTSSLVTWDPADNPFRVDTPYTATVTLDAREGYFFDFPVFAHADTLSPIQYTGGGNSVTLTIGFPATSTRVVDETALSDSNIIYPVIEATPVTVFVATSSQYTGSTITWYKGRGSRQEISPPTEFAVNNYYTAVVTLTAAEGFTFTGAGQFTYASKKALVPTSTSPITSGTVTVEISFPELTRVTVSGTW
jgi:hypothetical protein